MGEQRKSTVIPLHNSHMYLFNDNIHNERTIDGRTIDERTIDADGLSEFYFI